MITITIRRVSVDPKEEREYKVETIRGAASARQILFPTSKGHSFTDVFVGDLITQNLADAISTFHKDTIMLITLDA